MPKHLVPVTELGAASSAHLAANGAVLVEKLEVKAALLLYWLQYLSTHELTGTANSLLFGISSAIREAASSLALGLVRSAMFSLRAEVDMALSWLYFKDHPIEFAFVERQGDGFKLKSEVLEYLGKMHPDFKARLGLLKQIKNRKEEEPYRLLSAHIHSQSTLAVPKVSALKEVVYPLPICMECVELQFECSEYLNDVFMSIFLNSWQTLPAHLTSALKARKPTNAQKTALFSTTN